MEVRFPAGHAAFVDRCHQAGQLRGQRNAVAAILDLATTIACTEDSLTATMSSRCRRQVLLSEPGRDFEGGEFVLTEQRPRMQTRAAVAPLKKGDAVVFAVNSRPVNGSRGDYRVKLRHGVSRVRSGHRHTLGLIFHDAR